jgi:hypothetical protein
VKEEKKEAPEFSVVSDLPPTEEVSDNELETLDELEQDFGNLKSSQFDNQPSDNSFVSKHLSFNQFTPLNTYSHSAELKQLPHSKLLIKGVDRLDTENCAQQSLVTEYCRPTQPGFPGTSAFSPHSPVSSPELNDLEDIGSNSPTAFASQAARTPPYPHPNFDTCRQDSNKDHNIPYSFVRSQQYQPYFEQDIDRKQSPKLQTQEHNLLEADRYTKYSHPEAVIQSPERRLERSGSYNQHSRQTNRPYYNRSGSDSDTDDRYRVSPRRENSPLKFDRGIMARDRHSNNHRSNNYDTRDQKARNYLRESENDHYEANSKHSRQERSMSSDKNSYLEKVDNMHKKKDKKTKKSKKNKKDKKSKDYRSGSRKGIKGDEYDDMDGSPVSSDLEMDGRDSRSSYQHGSTNRSRSGKIIKYNYRFRSIMFIVWVTSSLMYLPYLIKR